jgi:hypothetical protein
MYDDVHPCTVHAPSLGRIQNGLVILRARFALSIIDSFDCFPFSNYRLVTFIHNSSKERQKDFHHGPSLTHHITVAVQSMLVYHAESCATSIRLYIHSNSLLVVPPEKRTLVSFVWRRSSGDRGQQQQQERIATGHVPRSRRSRRMDTLNTRHVPMPRSANARAALQRTSLGRPAPASRAHCHYWYSAAESQ